MVTTLVLIIIYLSFISVGLPVALLGSAWPSMYLDFNVDASLAGVISLIVSGFTIVSSLMSDRLVRRFGTAKVVNFAVLLSSLSLVGNAIAPNLLFLCLMAIPMGFGAGAIDATLNNYVALHYKARHMNWLHCFWGIGAFISPLIMSFSLSRLDSWRMGYLIVGIAQALVVVLIFFTRGLWDKVGTSANTPTLVEQEVLSIVERLRIPGAKSALLSFFAYCGIESMAGLWAGTYMVLVRGLDEITASKWVSLFYVGITLGRFLGGFFTFKLSTKKMVRLGIVFIFVSIVMTMMPLSNGYLQIALFLLGFGCAPIFPSLLQDTPWNFGAARSQSMIGIQVASAFTGATIVPPIFGWLSKFIGYEIYPYFIAVLFVFMFIAIFRLEKVRHVD